MEEEFSHLGVETRIERFLFFFQADVCSGDNRTTKQIRTPRVAFLQFSMFLKAQGVESSRFLVSGVTGVKRLGTTGLDSIGL